MPIAGNIAKNHRLENIFSFAVKDLTRYPIMDLYGSKNCLTVAPRQARGNSARQRATPHKFVSRGLKANPPPSRKFRKSAIFSTPARS
jgi:hypothetical protein